MLQFVLNVLHHGQEGGMVFYSWLELALFREDFVRLTAVHALEFLLVQFSLVQYFIVLLHVQ